METTINGEISYQTQDLYATSIGTTRTGRSVSCKMKKNGQATRFKNQDRSLSTWLQHLYLRTLARAYDKIKKKAGISSLRSSCFLPAALNEGKQQIMGKYLSILRKKNINCYINLNIPNDSQYPSEKELLNGEPKLRMTQSNIIYSSGQYNLGSRPLDKNTASESHEQEAKITLEPLKFRSRVQEHTEEIIQANNVETRKIQGNGNTEEMLRFNNLRQTKQQRSNTSRDSPNGDQNVNKNWQTNRHSANREQKSEERVNLDSRSYYRQRQHKVGSNLINVTYTVVKLNPEDKVPRSRRGQPFLDAHPKKSKISKVQGSRFQHSSRLI